jgi:hypothetical protein
LEVISELVLELCVLELADDRLLDEAASAAAEGVEQRLLMDVAVDDLHLLLGALAGLS